MRPVCPSQGGPGRYELVIRLIKITNVAAEGPARFQTASRLGTDRDIVKTALVTVTDMREGVRGESQVHSTGLLYAGIQKLNRQGLLFEVRTDSRRPRADELSRRRTVSWINVIALPGLLGHRRLLVHFSSTKPARFNGLLWSCSVSEVIKSRHVDGPL